jgi:hypothetical protein
MSITLRRILLCRARSSGLNVTPLPNNRSNNWRGFRIGGSGWVSLFQARLFV